MQLACVADACARHSRHLLRNRHLWRSKAPWLALRCVLAAWLLCMWVALCSRFAEIAPDSSDNTFFGMGRLSFAAHAPLFCDTWPGALTASLRGLTS